METINSISLSSVSKIYDEGLEFQALKKITLNIRKGESVAIMGPSGSGKSTLLNLLAGLDSPTSGEILIDGINLADLTDDERTRLRREKIGMIFQNFNLLPTLSALENVSLPLLLQGVSDQESRSRAAEMLELVDLTKKKDNLPDQMSGGEKQRVAIARSLVFQPQILLADEPTGNLDSKSGKLVLDKIKELHEKFGTTVLLVTHDDFAAGYCDRSVILKDGKLAS